MIQKPQKPLKLFMLKDTKGIEDLQQLYNWLEITNQNYNLKDSRDPDTRLNHKDIHYWTCVFIKHYDNPGLVATALLYAISKDHINSKNAVEVYNELMASAKCRINETNHVVDKLTGTIQAIKSNDPNLINSLPEELKNKVIPQPQFEEAIVEGNEEEYKADDQPQIKFKDNISSNLFLHLPELANKINGTNDISQENLQQLLQQVVDAIQDSTEGISEKYIYLQGLLGTYTTKILTDQVLGDNLEFNINGDQKELFSALLDSSME